MTEPRQMPPMVTYDDNPVGEPTRISDGDADLDATVSLTQDADRDQTHEIGPHSFQYRGPGLPVPAAHAGWYHWRTGARTLAARTLGPSETLEKAVEFARWTVREEGLREEPREYEGTWLQYYDEQLDPPGWYAGPVKGEPEAGPFEDYDEACASITDCPLRHKLRQDGRFTFQFVEDDGWRYWLIPDPSNVIARGFATFAEASCHAADRGEAEPIGVATTPTDQPVDIVTAGLIFMGVKDGPPPDQPAPGEAEKFPPVLALLINEFDWRHHSESLQRITRPFAALALTLIRNAPQPYWTERALGGLIDARNMAMKAWSYAGETEADDEE